MGSAKAAELNGFAAPAHALELAAQLRLTKSKNRLLDTSPTQPLLPVAATAFLKPVIW